MSDSEINILTPRLPLWIIIGLVVFLHTGCSTSENTRYEENETYYYRSYTGSDLIREQIKESFESIKRIQNRVVYQTYYFEEEDLPRQSYLRNADIENLAVHSEFEDHSTAGTALTMSNRGGLIVLLTAAHIVSFPDTVWRFSDESSPGSDNRVEAVSVKKTTNHFMNSDGQIIIFDVVVTDSARDLAVLKRDMTENESRTSLKALSIPPGDADQMDWTDMVYAVGFPKGVPMVTSGMMSNVSLTFRRSLVLDTSFNRGFSGGALFAVRSDGSGLEWVGMVIMASAEREYYVAPRRSPDDEYEPGRIYEGPLSVESTFRLNYGITFAININEIGNFFSENEEQLLAENIRIPRIQ